MVAIFGDPFRALTPRVVEITTFSLVSALACTDRQVTRTHNGNLLKSHTKIGSAAYVHTAY